MNLMKLLLINFIICSTLLADHKGAPQLLSAKDTLISLEPIKSDAIVFGEGKKEIHAFIDPLCSLSQRYLSFVFAKKELMFKKYKFYFYLYELPSKNSKELISTILSSEYKNTMLKTVMLNHQDVIIDEGEGEDIADKIEEVAKKIGVFKRPYILINGKVKL